MVMMAAQCKWTVLTLISMISVIPACAVGKVSCEKGEVYLLEDDVYKTTTCSVSYAGGAYFEGPVERVNKAGVVVFRSSFHQGELHGDYEIWFDSGEKAVDGAFQFGKKQGKWFFYSKNGDVEKVEEYDQGILIRKYVPKSESKEDKKIKGTQE